MQSFFWPSIVLFYAGLVVLVVDLWLEALALLWKLTVWAVILGVMVTFLFVVVLRESPLDISCSINNAHEVYIAIHNGSDSDDYRDLDLTFGTDSDHARFHDVRSASYFPSIIVVEPDRILRKQGDELDLYDERPGRWTVLYKRLRIRCPILPKHSSAQLQLNVVVPNGNPGPLIPATDWRVLTTNGDFAGRFRNVRVAQLTYRH